MKKRFRLIISTLCVGVLLFAAFILAVNLYVQSAGVQARIRVALSESLGVPVSMFRATFSPWGGFRLDQIKIPSHLPGAKTDFLKAECLEVRCEFIPLVQGRVVLRRIALDVPQFVFQKNEKGQFQLPRHADKIKVPSVGPGADLPTTSMLPEAIYPPTRTHPSVPEITPPVIPLLPKAATPDFDVRKWLLRDGSFRFLAQDGRELLRLESVRISLNARETPNSYAGGLEIKKAILLNRWEITDIEASITLENGKLHIDKLGGAIGEGRLEGEAKADLNGEGNPFNFWLRLNKGQLAKFFNEDSDWAGELTGLVHARLEYAGFATREDPSKGHAEFKVSRARISHLPLFQIVGQLLHSEELSNLSIKKTEIKADINGSQIQITPSYLESDHLQITFSGPLDSQQNLDLKAQLLVEDSLFKKLPSEVRENFVQTEELKPSALDFVITGPLSSPHTNLMNRLIGDKLQKKFKSILGGSDRKESKDKAASQTAPKP